MACKKRLTPALALSLLMGAVTGHAQSGTELSATTAEARRYTVEVILFRYSDSASNGDEVFPPDPPLPAEYAFGLGEPQDPDANQPDETIPEFGDLIPVPDDSVPAKEPELEEIELPGNRIQLRVLLPGELQLAEVYNKLQLLDAYEPVLWTGWSQLALERETTPMIPLRRLGNAPLQFDGEFQLYLSRFLHLVVNMSMTPRQQGSNSIVVPSFGDKRNAAPLDLNEAFQPGIVHLRIDEDRIVNSGDLRYFDHPRFGLLAKISRVGETADQGEPASALPEE
ncbi:MAG: hypothetical protein KDI09_21185 [Halioglobus sp.]|nr:hypothetical protein [Halioglobus sp.]